MTNLKKQKDLKKKPRRGIKPTLKVKSTNLQILII